MVSSKRYRSIKTGETVGFYTLAHGTRVGAYSIDHVCEGVLLVNGKRYELVNGEADDSE